MHIVLANGHVYDDAANTAHRLEREQLIERQEYEVTPWQQFPLCEYCDEGQHDAVLSWSWDRRDATTDGSADCCLDEHCCKAVLSEAEQDADPENILVEHPVVVIPNTPALAA